MDVMNIALSLLLQLVLPTGAYAETPQVARIDVTGYGIYTGTRTGTIAIPGMTLGTVTGLGDIRHAQNTRTIPGQVGVCFGFRYNVVGSPNGAAVSLHMVVIFPAPGLVNPETHQYRVQDEFDNDRSVGGSPYLGYCFDREADISPGAWTLQIWYQGRKLAEQSFTVVKQ